MASMTELFIASQATQAGDTTATSLIVTNSHSYPFVENNASDTPPIRLKSSFGNTNYYSDVYIDSSGNLNINNSNIAPDGAGNGWVILKDKLAVTSGKNGQIAFGRGGAGLIMQSPQSALNSWCRFSIASNAAWDDSFLGGTGGWYIGNFSNSETTAILTENGGYFSIIAGTPTANTYLTNAEFKAYRRFTVSAITGYVGIGTSITEGVTAPSRRLEVRDDAAAQLRLTYGATSQWTEFWVDSAGDMTITNKTASRNIYPGTDGQINFGSLTKRFESFNARYFKAYDTVPTLILTTDSSQTTNARVSTNSSGDLYLFATGRNILPGDGTTTEDNLTDIGSTSQKFKTVHSTQNIIYASADVTKYNSLTSGSSGGLILNSYGTASNAPALDIIPANATDESIRFEKGSNYATLGNYGSVDLSFNSSGATGAFLPKTTVGKTLNLGSTGSRWDNIYGTTIDGTTINGTTGTITNITSSGTITGATVVVTGGSSSLQIKNRTTSTTVHTISARTVASQPVLLLADPADTAPRMVMGSIDHIEFGGYLTGAALDDTTERLYGIYPTHSADGDNDSFISAFDFKVIAISYSVLNAVDDGHLVVKWKTITDGSGNDFELIRFTNQSGPLRGHAYITNNVIYAADKEFKISVQRVSDGSTTNPFDDYRFTVFIQYIQPA